MFCERCGRFCMFKKTCSDCARETSVRPLEGAAYAGARFLDTPASTLGTQVKTSCVMSINVNGRKATFDLGGGITDRLVRQVADQTKLSLEEARHLLQAQGSPERLMELGKAMAEVHRPASVKCPACARDVSPGKFCSQCGQALNQVLL